VFYLLLPDRGINPDQKKRENDTMFSCGREMRVAGNRASDCCGMHAAPSSCPAGALEDLKRHGSLSGLALTDHVVNRLQPFATALGHAAGADAWAVEIFAEEVVRGGPAFPLSLVLTALEPALRAAAELGAWQVGVRDSSGA